MTPPGFERVREAFARVLERQNGAGASFAAWHDGHWVTDVWGGYTDRARTRPWAQDTLVMPYSVTKPFAAVCALVLVQAGVLDLDTPVQRYWPQMRARTTPRQMLAHRSGLVTVDEPMPAAAWQDWDRICTALAGQVPAWEPGTAHGESALFYGHLVGELVRRIDGRALGRFLREEVTGPLGLDFHVGLGPDEQARAAELTGFGPAFRRSLVQGRPPLMAAALANPAGATDPAVVNSPGWRACEVPAVNGHGTARSVAGFYAALARGGLLGEQVVEEMTRGQHIEVDRVVGGEPRAWGLGVAVEDDGWGMGGIGGSTGWWCTDGGGYAVAYLTSHVADHGPATQVEDALREVLDLPALDPD
jgi:CubicO group peptidase (beta-lactamase class C family)